jgi:hypothetical protein
MLISSEEKLDLFQWQRETFEERPILAKYKEGDNFNRRNTLSISRIEI